MSSLLALLFGAALVSQTDASATPEEKVEEKAEASARLEFMKESVAVYKITRGQKQVPLKLLADPVLRWTNPVSNIPDGALFLWIGPDERPQVAAQVFIAAGTKDLWLHEFSSLSLEPLSMTRGGTVQWQPRKAGIEFKKVEGAPDPADSAVRRLSQMRNIVQDFKAGDDFEGKSRWELRLMAKPLYRYGADNGEILDGALFTLAHGTDPELLVAIEARRSGEGEGKSAWYYGLAPMTAYALKVSRKGEEIWSAPYRQNPSQPNEPFIDMVYRP